MDLHFLLPLVGFVVIIYAVMRPEYDGKSKLSYYKEKEWIIYDMCRTIGKIQSVNEYKKEYGKTPDLLYRKLRTRRKSTKKLILSDYDWTVLDIAGQLDVEYELKYDNHYDRLIYFGIMHEALEDSSFYKTDLDYYLDVEIIVYCLKRLNISSLNELKTVMDYSVMEAKLAGGYDKYKSLFYFAKEYLQYPDRKEASNIDHYKKIIGKTLLERLLYIDKKYNYSAYLFTKNDEEAKKHLLETINASEIYSEDLDNNSNNK